MSEWTIGDVLDAIADVVPDRVMTVAETGGAPSRSRRSAPAGSRTSWPTRDSAPIANVTTLERWECGQDRVALIMYNDLYPDMVIGCLKARTVPVNVNHHYTPREIGDLLDYVQAPRGHLPPLAGRQVRRRAAARQRRAVGLRRRRKRRAELPGAVALDDALAQGDTDHSVTRVAG